MSPDGIKQVIKLFLNTYKKKIKSKEDRKQFVQDVEKLAATIASEFENEPIDISEFTEVSEQFKEEINRYQQSVDNNVNKMFGKHEYNKLAEGELFTMKTERGLTLQFRKGMTVDKLRQSLETQTQDEAIVEHACDAFSSFIKACEELKNK